MTNEKLQFIERVRAMTDEEFNFVRNLFIGNAEVSTTPTTNYEAVTLYLKRHGFVANLQGYNYVRVALLTMIEEPDSFDSHITTLYNIVGEKLNTTGKRVERSIRHAIENAASNYPEMFTHFSAKEVPTVSEFLYTAVDELTIKK